MHLHLKFMNLSLVFATEEPMRQRVYADTSVFGGYFDENFQDGSILHFKERGFATNSEADTRIGNLLFGSKGWMSITNDDVGKSQVYYAKINTLSSGYSTYKEETGPMFVNETPESSDTVYIHFKNFIDCVRSKKWQDLNGGILDGDLSSSLCHLGNITCRLKRLLHFNPYSEKYINVDEAESYLTKMYRAPYILPEKH